MANITAALVKELRERTNAGMMDCKKALVESDGDMDKAIDWLREKGLAQAAKKAGRIAAEGAVVAYMTPCGCTGALVEVNCETDFVANTDNFKNFANAVAKHVALANPADLDELMKQKFVDDESKTIEDMVSDATVAIGEKITVRRFARYETEGVVSSYIHMGGKVGVSRQEFRPREGICPRRVPADCGCQAGSCPPRRSGRRQAGEGSRNSAREGD